MLTRIMPKWWARCKTSVIKYDIEYGWPRVIGISCTVYATVILSVSAFRVRLRAVAVFPQSKRHPFQNPAPVHIFINHSIPGYVLYTMCLSLFTLKAKLTTAVSEMGRVTMEHSQVFENKEDGGGASKAAEIIICLQRP